MKEIAMMIGAYVMLGFFQFVFAAYNGVDSPIMHGFLWPLYVGGILH